MELSINIRDLDENIEDVVIMPKILRYLPLSFDMKILDTREMREIYKLTMDELHKILIPHSIQNDDRKGEIV